MFSMIFKPAARYPADPRAVFILALSVFSGMTALALGAAPETLDSLLPHWAVTTWAVLLTAGSVLTLGGMARQTLGGIILEQIGSVTVGAATVFYAGLALWIVGPNALQSVGIVMAWGVACFVRWGQLQVLLHDAGRRLMKKAMLEQVYAEIEAHEAKKR